MIDEDLLNDLGNLLLFYFRDEFYKDGVEAARNAIRNESPFRERWPEIVEAIRDRALPSGAPLELMISAANLPLDEDSDEEAYVWLDKMVANLERTDDEIDEY